MLVIVMRWYPAAPMTSTIVSRTLRSFAAAALSFGLVFALTACAGDDGGDTDTDTDTSSSTTSPGSTSAGSTSAGSTSAGTESTGDSDSDTTATTTDTGGVPTYAEIQAIWDGSCVTGCHAASGIKADLSLESGASYANLVGKMSIQVTLDIVEPGDTEKSYLWLKLQGTHTSVGGSGAMMPLGKKLPDAELNAVEAWIVGGAAN